MTSKPIVGLTEDAILAVSSVWNSKKGDLRSLIQACGLDASKDFRGGDFRGWPLAEQDVRGIDFSGADLRETGIHNAIFDKTTNFQGAILDSSPAHYTASEVSPAMEARFEVRERLVEARAFSRRGKYRDALRVASEAMLVIEEWGGYWGLRQQADLSAKCLTSVRLPPVISYVDHDVKDSIYSYKTTFREGISRILRMLVAEMLTDSRLAQATFRYLNEFLRASDLVLSSDDIWDLFNEAIEANVNQIEYDGPSIGHFTLLTLAARTAAVRQRYDLANKFLMEVRTLTKRLNELHSSARAEFFRLQIAITEAQLEASAGNRASAASVLLEAIDDRLRRRDWPFRHEANVIVGGDDIIEAFEMLTKLSTWREYSEPLKEALSSLRAGHIGAATTNICRKVAGQLQSLAGTLSEVQDLKNASMVLRAEVELRRFIFDRSANAQSGGHLVRAAVRYRMIVTQIGETLDMEMLDWIEQRLMALHESRPSNRSKRNVTEISILKHVSRRSN